MLRRGDVLSAAPASGPTDAAQTTAPPAWPDRRATDLTPRSSLRAFTEAAPGLRDELVDRARSAGLLICWVAVLAIPAWTLVDRIAVPDRAGLFLAVRLLCEIPMLLAMWALWRLPLGRR